MRELFNIKPKMSNNHKFSYSEEERRKRQQPEEILKSIGLKKSMCFIDSGCNDGFFTLPASRIIGSNGRVIAIDVDEDALTRLRAKLINENISNVEIIKSPSEEVIVEDNIADIIFFGTVLHDFYDPVRVLRNSKMMLKDSGFIYNLDWRKAHSPIGPPYNVRFSQEDVTVLAKKSGLNVVSKAILDDNCYGIILKK